MIAWCVAIEAWRFWFRFWSEAATRGYEAGNGPGAEIIDLEEWKASHPERAA